MSNDISNNNVHSILKTYFRNRFQGISPSDFEKLLGIMFSRSYDSVKLTKKTGDFGADLILMQNGQRLVVEAKRYRKSNKVSNQLVNNLIAAKNYYKCDKGIFITTSDFTKSAKIIADASDIELWNWERLTVEISKAFWEGKNYFDYYNITQVKGKPSYTANGLKISVNKILHALTEDGKPVNWVYLDIENRTEDIIQATILNIQLITSESRQYDFDGFHVGYFRSGRIYPKAVVSACFYFTQQKVGIIKEGAQIFLGVEINRSAKSSIRNIKLITDEQNFDRKSTPEDVNKKKKLELSEIFILLTVIILVAIVIITSVVVKE